MGSLPNPKTLIPYLKTKDCSQGFCTLYCPQWCTTIIFPPPPPLVDDKTDDSDPTFSPLVIAIIGILASAFLLVSYYAIISKYCGRRNTDQPIVTNQNHHDQADQPSSDLEPELLQAGDHGHELWYVSNNGLDEALIKSITVCKYKKGDGLTACTDCSVCLGEFREDEDLRLLPKCTHAFHVHCIDTWLKSHSNCPLCRANIGSSLPVLVPQILYEPSHVEARDHTIVEIREDHQEEEEQRTSEERSEMRRSVSMSNYYRCQTRVCEADASVIGPEAGYRVEEFNGSRGLGGVDMKRSFSSGRNQFCKGWKGRNSVIPL